MYLKAPLRKLVSKEALVQRKVPRKLSEQEVCATQGFSKKSFDRFSWNHTTSTRNSPENHREVFSSQGTIGLILPGGLDNHNVELTYHYFGNSFKNK